MNFSTSFRRGQILCLVAVLAAACDSTPEEPENQPPEEVTGCVPDAAQWEEIKPLVDLHCAGCHGPAPDYGAPHDLSSYDALLVRDFDITRAELGARRVGQGTMPPIGMPGMTPEEVAKFVDWATCSEGEYNAVPRLTVNRPVFLGPSEPPTDVPYIDLVAPDFPIETGWVDRYQCFTFEIPFDEDQFIRRIEIVEDKSEVLHHVVLLRDNDKNAPLEPHNCVGMPSGSDYLYAWAPGTGAVQFEDGGLRAQGGERYVLQLHYNNGAGIEDLKDSSGVRLYHGPAEGTEYGMVAIGPVYFQVPGRTAQDVTGECSISQETRLLAGMPHMHEIGDSFSQEIVRASGERENLIDLKNWDFETQLFYSTPITLSPGDRIETRCGFDNPNTGAVTAGPKTEDEMCFNFMYVTPPPPARYCDDVETSTLEDVEYTAGQCLEGGIDAPALVEGRFVVGEVDGLDGGTISAGTYELKAIEIWRESAATPIGDIDLERSKILARGQAVYQDGAFTMDADIVSDVLLTTGQSFTQPATSVSFTMASDTSNTEALVGEAVCAQAPAQIPYVADGTTLRFAISGNAFNVNFQSVYEFELK